MSFNYAKLPGFRLMRVRENDADWWFEQHDRYKWTYARTMPFAPHYYIWRDKEMTTDDYDRMFGAVRALGTIGKYWDRTQIYLINPENNYRYWLVDVHWYTCTILNMATDGRTYGVQDAPDTSNPHFAEYDQISPWWDDVYKQHEKRDGQILWKLVHNNTELASPTLLDIGAGTGGTLDAKVAPSRNTLAIDPSQGMLNDLVVKYPDVGNVFSGTFGEYIDNGTPVKKDLVVASLGSGSYLQPNEVEAAFDLSKHLTVLSFYNEVPSHREEMPETHHDALETAKSLGAKIMVHGNFIHAVARGSA